MCLAPFWMYLLISFSFHSELWVMSSHQRSANWELEVTSNSHCQWVEELKLKGGNIQYYFYFKCFVKRWLDSFKEVEATTYEEINSTLIAPSTTGSVLS